MSFFSCVKSLLRVKEPAAVVWELTSFPLPVPIGILIPNFAFVAIFNHKRRSLHVHVKS